LLLFFFFTLVTGPRRSLHLKLSDTRVYEPQIRYRDGGRVASRRLLPAPVRRERVVGVHGCEEDQLKRCYGLLPESQNLALTALYVPYSLDSGPLRFRGGLVFKAHRLLYHSTLGLRVIKKKVHGCTIARFAFRESGLGCQVSGATFRVSGAGCRVKDFGFRVQGFGCMVSGVEFRL